jgi:MFS family permease
MQISSIKNNILLLHLIKFSKWFMLFMPIIVIFFQDNGLEMRHIFMLKAINAITVVILEIPSGYMADVLGRKKTLVLGTMLSFAGFVAYSIAHGFWGFAIAELLIGVSMSFISGADSAMLYDTLLHQNKSEQYSKQEGRITAIGNFSEAAAGILGGLLAGISLRLPFIAQAGIAFIGIPAALLLIEPELHKTIKKTTMRAIAGTMKVVLVDNKLLRAYILFSSFAGMTSLTLAWFIQPYWSSIEIPLTWFGLLWTALNLSVALTAFFAYKIQAALKPVTILFLVAIVTGGGFISLGFSNGLWGIAILFAIYLVRGLGTPILKDFINQHTPSDVRATVLSIRSFIIRIAFAAISPLLGWYTDHYDLGNALILAGGVFTIGMLISIIFYLKESQKS